VFFGEAAVRWIILSSSITFLMTALQIVPRALLTRDLDFRRLAWADGAEALVAAGATLAFAAVGLRYWALVLGPLAGRLTSTVLINAWRSHRLAWPRRFASIAAAVSFGWQVVVARIAWYFYSNADFAVVGRVLGKAALGAYTLGWTISSIPVDRVSALVASVTPAVFSAVQHDPPALQRYLRNLTEGLALVTFPGVVGHPTCVLPLFLVAGLRVTGLSLATYLKALGPAVGATLVMAATVLAMRWATPAGLPASLRLGMHVFAGVGAYGAVLYFAHRPRVRALWALVRELRG